MPHDIEDVLARHTPELMRIEGVAGVGQGLCDGMPCIRIYVLDAAARARIPATVEGYRTAAVVTGRIRPTTDG